MSTVMNIKHYNSYLFLITYCFYVVDIIVTLLSINPYSIDIKGYLNDLSILVFTYYIKLLL